MQKREPFVSSESMTRNFLASKADRWQPRMSRFFIWLKTAVKNGLICVMDVFKLLGCGIIKRYVTWGSASNHSTSTILRASIDGSHDPRKFFFDTAQAFNGQHQSKKYMERSYYILAAAENFAVTVQSKYNQ